MPSRISCRRSLRSTRCSTPLSKEQAAHCGYCYNGMTIKASELLARNPRPSEAEIRIHMNGHLCRCGTYGRVMKAIQLASAMMTENAR